MTPRQQRFIDEYLLDLNATQAAVRGGLQHAHGERTIEAAQQARSNRVQITQDDVLRGLRREATLTGEGSTHAARVCG